MNYIFDFDGTIADSLVAFIAIFNKNARNSDNPMTAEEIEKLRGMSSRKAIKMAGVRWWQLPKVIMHSIPDFHALVPTLKTFPELPETLQKLQARGDKLFIVTSNTETSVNEFLDRHKLAQYFSAIDTGAGVFSKASHIRNLMDRNNLKRRETVYVGDETRDIQAARLALVKVVSVTWGFNTAAILKRRHPNFLIDTPKQLLDIKLWGYTAFIFRPPILN